MSTVHALLYDGLVAYYPMNGNTNDVFGAYNLNIAGNVVPSTNNVAGGYSMNFTGTSNSRAYSTSTLMAWNQSRTTCLWMNQGELFNTSTYTFFSYTNSADSTHSGSLDTFDKDGGAYDFRLIGGNTNVIKYTNTSVNTWIYWCLVHNGSTTSSIYADGLLVSQGNADFAGSTSNRYFVIGGFNDNYNIKGLVDEVGIWNRSLSQAEITHLYNGGAGLAYPFNSIYNMNCTSCSPPYGDVIPPYETDDATPTFTFSTTTSQQCRIGDQNINYTAMGDSRNCTSDQSTQVTTCTLTAQDGIVDYNTTIYISCNTNEANNASIALPMLISSLDTPNSSEAIQQGIENSVIGGTGVTVYTNQKVYLRMLNGSTFTNTVDKVAVYGNQRWIFNYENMTALDGMFNLSPVVYSLNMKNMSVKAIRANVTAFINATKI